MHSKIKLPNPGDIVWFLHPDDSKMRPGVVLGVSKRKHEVIVAFGTSQKTHKLYPSEFLIAKTDGDEAFGLSGLSYDTKFDLARTCILPFTTEFFAKAPRKNNVPPPKMGSVHIMYNNAMRRAKKNSK
ncbi:hypothetical protein V7I42_08320 [Raoultella ornithinolytica]|uniref:hypothetical protein n=1 Tax=Raoultella ornithinolytica TaxID=54291 RepID=UPI002FF3587C